MGRARARAVFADRDATSELGLDLAQSFRVGDKMADVEAVHSVGCTTILPAGRCPVDFAADHVARDWNEIVGLVAPSPGVAA